MSWWDIIVLGAIFLALLRGYKIGLCRRLTGWVGGFLVFFGVWFNYSRLAKWVDSFFDGEAFFQARVLTYLENRYPADNPLSKGDLEGLVEALPLGHSATQEALRALESSGAEVRMTMLDKVADLIGPILWQAVLFLVFIFFGHLLLSLLGQALKVLFERLPLLDRIDSYVGAIVSGILGVALMALVSVILMTLNGGGEVGTALESSFFAPALRDAFLVFVTKGVH